MALIVILGLGLVVMTGVTWVVLFIVGLVKHLPGLWGSGVGLGVLAMVVAAAGAIGTVVSKKAGQSRTAAAACDMSLLRAALDTFEVDCGRYPSSEEGLQALGTPPPGLAGWHGPYLRRGLPTDPWGHPYVYRCPGQDDLSGYDLHSLGPDGRDGTADDIDSLPLK